MMSTYMTVPHADLRHGAHNSSRPMNCDILDFEDRYELNLELPGFQKQEIKISLEKNYLTVEAVHPKAENENCRILHSERYNGPYLRTFHVGDDVDDSAVTAKYENGILQIVLQKRKEVPAPSGRIEIQ